MIRNKLCCVLFLLTIADAYTQDIAKISEISGWQIIKAQGIPEKREDCSFVEVKGLFYLVGGRGILSVDVFDPQANTWISKSKTPIELNHFQAIVYKNNIYMLGAMNGSFPHEKPLENIYIYNTLTDQWKKGPAIPGGRLRGSGGSVLYKGKFYLTCGIQDGHYDGSVSWMDEFDPETGVWKTLPDAPHARDHFNAVVMRDHLYLAGGRRTSLKTKELIELTVPEIDVYDFKKESWTTLPASQNIPTQRAGCAAVNYKNNLVIIGGESVAQKESHHEVECYKTRIRTWTKLPPLLTGRHDTGAVTYKNKIYIASGSANRGGGPDQETIEVLVR